MNRPIIFFDLETTGKAKNPNNVRIIEISAVKVNPDTLETIDTYYHKCNNDGVPIDPDATERHGMTEQDLIGLDTFQSIAKEVYDFFEGCDVGGYYCTIFDIPILYYSFIRAGISWNYKTKVFDIYSLYRKYNSGKLGEVYERYTGKKLEDAHHANADVMATIEVYKEQRRRGEEFEESDLEVFDENLDMPGNFKIRLNESGVKEVYIDFGKWKGTTVDKVDTSYFKWIMENTDFPVDTRHYAKKIYEMKNGEK